MVSSATTNALGAVGGVILAVCQAPQLIKLYRTKSAADLSYWYIVLYTCGLFFICIYLYLEDAIVGFVCEVLEFSCGLILIAAKFYLDNFGPLSARAKRRRHLAADVENQVEALRSAGSADASGASTQSATTLRSSTPGMGPNGRHSERAATVSEHRASFDADKASL